MTESSGSMRVKKGDKDYKEQEETSQGFGYIHYLNYGDGFLWVYRYQNLSHSWLVSERQVRFLKEGTT